MTDWRARPLADLLAEHGLAGVEEAPFPADGWSGSTFTSLVDGHRRFVLKRISPERDWIVRATRDEAIREAWFAGTVADRDGALSSFLPEVRTPYLGAAIDEHGAAAILMPHLSTELLAWERPVHEPRLEAAAADVLIDRIARLHAVPWSEPGLDAGATPWCPLRERLTLLTRRSATGYAEAGEPVGDIFLRGWDAFDRLADRAARELLENLGEDPRPLEAALGRLPVVGLHGDLKLANVALLESGGVALIDWQMTLRAPVAVELGWCIVTNSAELPFPPEDVLRRYRESLGRYAGRWGAGSRAHDLDGLTGDWATQEDLVAIVGLLLRGWRKGRDAEGDVMLGSGVSAADDLAWWCRRAVEAADRRL